MAGPYWNGNVASKTVNQGAAEGAPFIRQHLIHKAERAFDDFAGAATDVARNRAILSVTAGIKRFISGLV